MTIPGYDPDDLEQTLEELLDEHGDGLLTEGERRRLAEGESILDVLDGEEIERLLAKGGEHPTESPSE